MKQAYNLNGTSMININLMQKREDRSNGSALTVLLIAAAAIVLSACGWMWMDGQSKLTSVNKQLSEAIQASSLLESKLLESTSSGQLSGVLAMPEQLIADKPLTTQLLSQLNKILPSLTNVTQLELDEQDVLKITIHAATAENIVSFSQSIQASDMFELIRLGTINNLTNAIGPAGDGSGVAGVTDPDQMMLPVYQTTIEMKYIVNR